MTDIELEPTIYVIWLLKVYNELPPFTLIQLTEKKV